MSCPEPHLARMAGPAGFAEVVLGHLRPYHPAGAHLAGVIERAVVQTLDSAMLIEDPMTAFVERPASGTRLPLPPIEVEPALEAAIAGTRAEGFAAHFHTLIGLFGHVMLTLAGRDDQVAAAREWVRQGLGGTFLMTDRGGPSLDQWHSTLVAGAEGARVRIDKIWGIDAARCGFAIAVVRGPGSIAPTALLIDPPTWSGLERSAVGLPYLDGAVQLGNCSGEVRCDSTCALTRGGLIAVKQFLTLVRPRFVLALMAHLQWLNDRGRLRLTDAELESVHGIEQTAGGLAAAGVLTRYSEDEVMALKFASNALLSHVVQGGSVQRVMDARDLLAFTKMEGSSYRCFYEIYQRNKRLRHG